MTRVANSLGEEVGGRGDRLAAMIDQTRALVGSLAARSDQIRPALATTGDLSATMAGQETTVNDAIAAGGPALQVIGDNTQNMVDLVGRIDAISQEIARFPSIGDQRPETHGGSQSARRRSERRRDRPECQPHAIAFDLGDRHSRDRRLVRTCQCRVEQVAVGPVPDPNFPGDPGARPPDATDWTNFAGSLDYSLNRLRDRVIGPSR